MGKWENNSQTKFEAILLWWTRKCYFEVTVCILENSYVTIYLYYYIQFHKNNTSRIFIVIFLDVFRKSEYTFTSLLVRLYLPQQKKKKNYERKIFPLPVDIRIHLQIYKMYASCFSAYLWYIRVWEPFSVSYMQLMCNVQTVQLFLWPYIDIILEDRLNKISYINRRSS